jgi:hypothetical protein
MHSGQLLLHNCDASGLTIFLGCLAMMPKGDAQLQAGTLHRPPQLT